MFFIKRHLTFLVASALAALLPLTIRAQSEEPQTLTQERGEAVAARKITTDPIMVGPVVWSSLATPVYPVAAADGRMHLIYELHVTNAGTIPARIRSVEVLDARDNSITGTNRALSPEGTDITGMVRPFSLPQTMDAANYANRLGAGQAGVIYFDVSYASLRAVPKQIKHRFIVTRQVPNQDPQTFTVIGSPIKVSNEEPLVIAPPLKGNNWLVSNGAGAIITPHRYTIQPANGVANVPERFAIDFIQLDAQGRAFTGDPSQLSSWPSYGAEVISATPGTVVEVVNHLPDLVPLAEKPPITIETVGGNHVIVDAGNGRYVFYAHLIPGSVQVSKGDFVQPGQLLGRLGNSGNSDAPHLHFHIMDAPAALKATGLPFVFDRMTFQGRFNGTLDDVIGGFFTGQLPILNPSGAGARALLMPLTLDLIGFR